MLPHHQTMKNVINELSIVINKQPIKCTLHCYFTRIFGMSFLLTLNQYIDVEFVLIFVWVLEIVDCVAE